MVFRGGARTARRDLSAGPPRSGFHDGGRHYAPKRADPSITSLTSLGTRSTFLNSVSGTPYHHPDAPRVSCESSSRNGLDNPEKCPTPVPVGTRAPRNSASEATRRLGFHPTRLLRDRHAAHDTSRARQVGSIRASFRRRHSRAHDATGNWDERGKGCGPSPRIPGHHQARLRRWRPRDGRCRR